MRWKEDKTELIAQHVLDIVEQTKSETRHQKLGQFVFPPKSTTVFRAILYMFFCG